MWLLGFLLATQTPVFSLGLPAEFTPKRAAGPVVARVGTVPIRVADVEPYLWDWASRAVVTDLANAQLVNAEAKRLSVSVSNAEVTRRVNAQLQEFRSQVPPGTNVEDALRERGYSPSRLWVMARTDLLLNAIALASLRKEQFVKVATLVIRPRSESLSDLSDAIKVAQNASERLAKGEEWSRLVAEVVSDANAKKDDGFLGWRNVEAFPATVRAELPTLAIGQVTKPVQTSFGIQIFRVLGQGKDAKGEELAAIQAQHLGVVRPKLLGELQKKTPIVWSPR